MNSLKFIVLICLSVFLFPLHAGIINVPADTSSIQGGIFLAGAGDTVLVAENTYYENINFNGKAITVASLFLIDSDTSHISNTIINGSQPANLDSGSVVYFETGEDTTSILCGFTITGGTGTNFINGSTPVNLGGGIVIFQSGAQILHNRISENEINEPGRYCYGGGIDVWCLIDKPAVIKYNEISHNSVFADWGGGGGAEISSAGKLLFKNNYVHHNLYNSQRAGHGGGVVILGSYEGLPGEVVMINNLIAHNEVQGQGTDSWGGGIYSEYPHLYLYNNIIVDNTADYGGGLAVFSLQGWADIARVRLINNTITRNTAGIGGAIWNRHSDAIIINSIMWGNTGYAEIQGQNPLNVDVHYSNVQGGFVGDGNIAVNPSFADNLCNLSDSSRCVGAGIDAIEIGSTWYYCPSTDYNGDPRPHSVDDIVDMGAIESDFPSGIHDNNISVPRHVSLQQNYPNPFNPSTEIRFTLPRREHVTLEVYNALSQKVSTLVDKPVNAGTHDIKIDAGHLPSGIYFYQLSAGDLRQVRKMVLLR